MGSLGILFGDCSRRFVDGGDCERGCKIGVCFDCFIGVSFAGVDNRFADVKGDDRIVSDLDNCGVESFSIEV